VIFLHADIDAKNHVGMAPQIAVTGQVDEAAALLGGNT
jgi:hypothetical protein